MDDAINLVSLERYWAGQCTPAERQRIEAWIERNPAQRDEVDAYRRLVEGIRSARSDIGDVEGAWARVGGMLGAPDITDQARDLVADRHKGSTIGVPTKPERPGTRPQTFFFRTRGGGGRLPAIWPRGVGGGAVALLRQRLFPFAVSTAVLGGLVLTAKFWRSPSAQATPWREYITGAGQRENVTLADGTRLTLAPESRVQIPLAFGTQDRRVKLEGEAFFVVVHDSSKPFVVDAANAVATDIGTQFDVRAYADDGSVRIAVAEGEVVIAAVPQPTTRSALVRGDIALVHASGSLSVTHGRDLTTLLSWRQGGLAFDDTPLHDVVKDLARAFDLDITVADSTLLAHRITSSFGKASADEVLDAISLAVGANYTRSGRRVVIRRLTGTGTRPSPSTLVLPMLTARTPEHVP